jgi:hypothetical protein
VCLLFCCTVVKAQVTFQKKFGGKLQESARSMEILPDGYLILGHTTTYSAGGDTDVYVIRTDLSGTTLWTKLIGGPGQDVGYCIKQTNDGNFIVCGSTSSSASSNADVWLFKMDKDAKVLWTKTQATTGIDVGYEVQQTTDNGYIVTGYTDFPGVANHDALLWKTDNLGVTQWYKTYGGPATDEGHSVKQTTDGGYIFIGETLNTPAGDRDFYLVKTTADGTTAWTKNYGGADYERGQYVELTSDGYILTGDTKSYGAGDYDVYVVKIDALGVSQWTKTYGGTSKDISKMIRKTNDGGYVVAGISRSFGRTNPDFWILKLKANGDTMWTKLYGASLHEHCYYANQTPDGGYIAVGHTVNAYTPDYDVDVYLVKMDALGNALSTGISEESTSQNQVNIFPNPSTGIINFEVLTGNKIVHSYILTDVAGRVILKENHEAGSQVSFKHLDLSAIPKGIYFLNLNNSSVAKKILLY